eukprot:15317337-Ditylum_brightwellii.AAC.1
MKSGSLMAKHHQLEVMMRHNNLQGKVLAENGRHGGGRYILPVEVLENNGIIMNKIINTEKKQMLSCGVPMKKSCILVTANCSCS